jgi:ArsR family transcriptional regulator
LTIEAARWASQVIAIDRSAVVLERARALAGRRRVSNVIWKQGELEKLPMKDASVDVALLSQALHHAGKPEKAVAEAARVTVPGGHVLILDLRQHQEEWVRSKLGDRALGFRDDTLKDLLSASGLVNVKLAVGARKTGDPFTVLVASATKPASAKQPALTKQPELTSEPELTTAVEATLTLASDRQRGAKTRRAAKPGAAAVSS